MKKKYGVTSAYMLANRKPSKGQQELYDLLKLHFKDIEMEFRVGRYFADIKIGKCLVEYNGTYWHCDPEKYDKKYRNKKKRLLAETIWRRDQKRIEFLKESGYIVFIVWESEFKADSNKVIKLLVRELHEQENKSFSYFRSPL